MPVYTDFDTCSYLKGGTDDAEKPTAAVVPVIRPYVLPQLITDDTIGNELVREMPEQGTRGFQKAIRVLLEKAIEKAKKHTGFDIDCNVNTGGQSIKLFAYQQVCKWLLRPRQPFSDLGTAYRLSDVLIKRAVVSWRTGSGKTLAMLSVLENYKDSFMMCCVLFTRANERSNFIKSCMQMPTFIKKYIQRRFRNEPKVMRDITDGLQWTCSCGSVNKSTAYQCKNCKNIHPDAERQIVQWLALSGELSKAGETGYLKSPIRLMTYAVAGGTNKSFISAVTSFPSDKVRQKYGLPPKPKGGMFRNTDKNPRFHNTVFVCDEFHNYLESISEDAKIVNPKLNQLYITKQKELFRRMQNSVNCYCYGFTATPIKMVGDPHARTNKMFALLKGGYYSHYSQEKGWSVPRTRDEAGFTKGRMNHVYPQDVRQRNKGRRAKTAAKNAAKQPNHNSRLTNEGFILLYEPDLQANTSRATFPQVLPRNIKETLGVANRVELGAESLAVYNERLDKAETKQDVNVKSLCSNLKNTVQRYNDASEATKKQMLLMQKYCNTAIGGFQQKEMKRLLQCGSPDWKAVVSEKIRRMAQRVQEHAVKGEKTLIVCPGTPSATFIHTQTAVCACLSIYGINWLALRSNRVAVISGTTWTEIEEPGLLSSMVKTGRNHMIDDVRLIVQKAVKEADEGIERAHVQDVGTAIQLNEKEEEQDDSYIETQLDIDLSSEQVFEEEDENSINDDDRQFDYEKEDKKDELVEGRTLPTGIRLRNRKRQNYNEGNEEDEGITAIDNPKDEDYVDLANDNDDDDNNDDEGIKGGQHAHIVRPSSPVSVTQPLKPLQPNKQKAKKPKVKQQKAKKPKKKKQKMPKAVTEGKRLLQACKTKIKKVVKNTVDGVRLILKFIYEDETSTLEKVESLIQVLLKQNQLKAAKRKPHPLFDTKGQLSQTITDAINDRLQKLLKKITNRYLKLFIKRTEAFGRTSKAQKRFVKLQLQTFNNNNNAERTKGKPVVLLINANHMESTSILGVRHVEFVCPPTSYGDYLQFKGRALRACASHIKNMPESKRTVTFYMNLSVFQNRQQRQQLYTVDEFFYQKLLEEQQQHDRQLHELVHKHAMDIDLYSQATTEEYKFKKKILNTDSTTLSDTSSTFVPITATPATPAITAALTVPAKKNENVSLRWAKRYFNKIKQQKQDRNDYLDYDLRNMQKRIAYAIADTLECLGLKLNNPKIHRLQLYIKHRLKINKEDDKVDRSIITLEMQDVQPVFEVVNGSSERKRGTDETERLQKELGLGTLSNAAGEPLYPFTGRAWLLVFLSYLVYMGYTDDNFGIEKTTITNLMLNVDDKGRFVKKRRAFVLNFRQHLDPRYIDIIQLDDLNTYLAYLSNLRANPQTPTVNQNPST